MKNTINIFIGIAALFFTFGGAIQAQMQSATLLAKLEEATNPESLTSTGNIRKTADGGYLIAGTRGSGEFARAFIIKTNQYFEPQWSERLDLTLTFGNSWQASYGVDVIELGNQEYAFLAAVNMNVFFNDPALQNLDYGFIRFKKSSSTSMLLSATRFGTEFNEVPHEMIRTSDGGFLLCGYSNPEQALNLPSKAQTFLVKLDEAGSYEWAHRYRNQASECNTGGLILLGMMRRNVIETQDGGYVFTMVCDENVYITKLDNTGEELWSKTFVSSSGFADGASGDLGAIGVAAGTGGTVIGVREMDNGDLAFLGNHFAYFISLLILDGNSNGAGVVLPFSYVFTTTSTGEFKKGAAFFHERYNDPNQPVEMTSFEFEVLPNDRFLIAAGMDQSGDGNGNTYFRPGFVELDIDKQNIDESVIRSATIGNDLPLYYVNDNARGMSQLNMNFDQSIGEVTLSYNMKHQFKVTEYLGLNANTDCVALQEHMHSFPFTLSLSDYEMVATDMAGASFAPLLSFASVSRVVECSEPPLAVTEIPETEVIAVIAPTVNDGHFELQIRDENWTDAQIRISDMTGKVVYSGIASGTATEISGHQWPAGIYLIQLRKNDRMLVLKMVVQR